MCNLEFPKNMSNKKDMAFGSPKGLLMKTRKFPEVFSLIRFAFKYINARENKNIKFRLKRTFKRHLIITRFI